MSVTITMTPEDYDNVNAIRIGKTVYYLQNSKVANENIPVIRKHIEKLESDNANLCGQLNTIGAKCGGQGNRIKKLEKAIRNTLQENGHLADGDNCTLFELKQAMKGEK